MLTDKFTLLQLVDLACDPEIGIVNFNILHTILKAIITEVNLTEHKTSCHVEDEEWADDVLAKGELESDKTETSLTNALKAITLLYKYMDGLQDRMANMEEDTGDTVDETETMVDISLTFGDRINALEEAKPTHEQLIEDCNAKQDEETQRLENIIKNLKMEEDKTKIDVESLQERYDDLLGKVAYKADLKSLRDETVQKQDSRMEDMTEFIRKIEDTLVKLNDFEELLSQAEALEDRKVNRDEVERLVEPGFVDGFEKELKSLRTEADGGKAKVKEIEATLKSLRKYVEEEIREHFEEKFAEIHAMLNAINKKLAQLDPDDINESFAKLNEQVAFIFTELEELQQDVDKLRKEGRLNFLKITNLANLIKKLDQTKANKAKLPDLLDLKADVDVVAKKVDIDEFAAFVSEIKDQLEKLNTKVKANAEEMMSQFSDIRRDLVKKMYSEDFIAASQPIRNRIRDSIYDLERVKEICRTHLYPDPPGMTKCMSCKRGAHLAGPKYAGDGTIQLPQEALKSASVTVSRTLLPTDIGSIPIPSPRERNPHKLPTLFATARPNYGVEYPKSRTEVDKKTHPQRLGEKITAVMLPQAEKEEVLLQGIDKCYYRGFLYEDSVNDEESPVKGVDPKVTADKHDVKSMKEPGGKSKPTINKPAKTCEPGTGGTTVVSLHVGDEPVKRTVTIGSTKQEGTSPKKVAKKAKKRRKKK